jgi:hypothetical protein
MDVIYANLGSQNAKNALLTIYVYMKKNLKALAILLLIAFNFTACGIKKDLFLPEKRYSKINQ